MFYNQTLLAANSTSQTRIATSAPEAELNEIYRTTKKILHYHGLLCDFGETRVQNVILTDSSSSLNTVHNPVSARYKFLAVQIFFLKQQIRLGMMKLFFMPRNLNIADLMTKQNTTKEYLRLWKLAKSPFLWVHETTRDARQPSLGKKGLRSQTV